MTTIFNAAASSILGDIEPRTHATPSIDIRDFVPYEITHLELAPVLQETNVFTSRIIARDKNRNWISYLGKSGTGKTYLAKAIRQALESHGFIGAQFWAWSVVANEYLRQGDFGIMGHLASLPLLILDDIGSVSDAGIKTFLASKLYEILDSRLGKWTIITSNLNPKQIAETLDARIGSRLFRNESKVLLLKEAKDYAMLKWAEEQRRQREQRGFLF